MRYYTNDLNSPYFQVNRHWSPISEKYAGGDCLLTAMSRGWSLSARVYFENFWHSGMRLVTVYHFELARDDETMVMPVISNPYVRRLLLTLNMESLPIEEREIVRRRERGGGNRS